MRVSSCPNSKINTTKMMLFSDKQEDSRWTDGTLLEFDIYSCIVTDVVIALHHLHGRAPPDEEQDLSCERQNYVNRCHTFNARLRLLWQCQDSEVKSIWSAWFSPFFLCKASCDIFINIEDTPVIVTPPPGGD